MVSAPRAKAGVNARGLDAVRLPARQIIATCLTWKRHWLYRPTMSRTLAMHTVPSVGRILQLQVVFLLDNAGTRLRRC